MIASAADIGTSPDIAKAKWIWSSQKGIAGGGKVNFFRREFELAGKPAEATVALTADNGYELYVNGQRVGAELGYSGRFWSSVERFRVEKHMWRGPNVIAIRGESLGGGAGVVAAAYIRLPGGQKMEVVTDKSWGAARKAEGMWTEVGFDETDWNPAAELGRMGMRPWGMLSVPDRLTDPKKQIVDRGRPGQLDKELVGKLVPPSEGFLWPSGLVFLRGAVRKPHHFAFTYVLPGRRRRSLQLRAYPENDVPAPAVLGRQMYALVPATPGAKPKLLLDAGKGTIGSPSVSYDGKTIYFSMAPEGEAFYHIFRIPAQGGEPEALTSGPFHDYDPEELPDGRIAFSSTRIGSREEYHGNLASSLFVMDSDGSSIRPLTYHIVADREPRITASGSLIMIRSDNFLERAKVETQIHQTQPDGTAGVVLLGNDRQTIGYNRVMGTAGAIRPGLLRQNGFGSPSPLPDGRVAALSKEGLIVSETDRGIGKRIKTSAGLFDISPLPDGRLLCTTIDRKWLGVVDPATGDVTGIHESKKPELHSAVYLGARTKPRTMPAKTRDDRGLEKTGYLYCQSVFNTKQTSADVRRIKAIRVYEGRPLALRPERFPYVHIGVESVELGTVPLAPDGSFYVRVPADRALALQAVDAEGRPVINELSWIYARPGERRSCTGCHSPRHSAPPPHLVGEAFHARPADLLGQGQPHRFRGNNAELGGILNLQLERFREAAAISLYAQPPLTSDHPLPPGRPTEVTKLVEQLASRDAGLRISAARRLAILQDRSAAPTLAQLWNDQEPDVRMNAALALSACGNRSSVPTLMKMLSDDDPLAAQATHVALENLTGHSAKFDPFTPDRAAGVSAWRTWLEGNGWELIELDLVKRLQDTDPQTTTLAAQTLGHIGGSAAKAALRDFVTRSLDRKNETKSDLRSIRTAMCALGHLRDEDAVPLLSGLLAGDLKKVNRRRVYVLATAAEALGRIGTPEAERALIAACARLADFWHYTRVCGDHPVLVANHSSVLHYRLLEALDAMGTRSPEVVPAFTRSVPTEQDRGLLVEFDTYENLVARVVQRSGLAPALMETCLSVLGDTDAKASELYVDDVTASPMPAYYSKAPLKELLKRGRGGLVYLPYDREMRAAQVASILCLAERFAPRLAAAFARYRSRDVSPVSDFPNARTKAWVCFYLAKALGKARHHGSVDLLLSALNDDPPEATFGYETPPSAILYKTITPMYRAAVAYALGRIGDRRAAPSLLQAVANLDNALDVRHSAAQALVLLCDRSHLHRLRDLAANYPEVATRRILLQACAQARAR